MLRAVIFDFDGVICDTEPLHCRAFAEVLRPLGIQLSQDQYFSRYAGLDDRAVLRAVLEDAGRCVGADETDRLLAAKDAAYFAMIADGIERCPGVDAFVAGAAGRWPLAVCSGARRIEIETILTQAGLMRHFAVIVSADEVASSKPDPAGYRQTLLELRRTVPDLLPAQCLAIEDSGHGIAAAHAAGMRVLAVESRVPSVQTCGADLAVPDLRSFTPDGLAAMVGKTHGPTG
jgi:beta-phosphoglucomutase